MAAGDDRVCFSAHRGAAAGALRALRAALGRVWSDKRRQVPLASVVALALTGACLVFAWFRFRLYAHPAAPGGAAFTDLNDFVLVGRMALSGRLAQAYALPTMHLAQIADGSGGIFMPWAYPPPYDLLTVGLARLGLAWGFVALSVLPFLTTLWLIRRLAGPWSGAVAIGLFPGFLICLMCGQNGFLTATLLGAFALAGLKRSAVAGVPLGLLVIKPHLGLLVGVQNLLMGRWRVLAAAFAVAVALSAAASFAFGAPVWLWFLQASRGAALALEQGRYTLHDMISPYATLRAAGLPAQVAFAVQSVLALAAVALTWLLIHRRVDPRLTQGLVLLMSLAVTPYAFDYDTPILAIAAALLAGPVLERARRWQAAVLLALSWVVSGSVLFSWLYVPADAGAGPEPWAHQAISFAGPGYVALILLVFWILRRQLVPVALRQPAAAGLALSPG